MRRWVRGKTKGSVPEAALEAGLPGLALSG